MAAGVQWVRTTPQNAASLANRAVVGGRDGFDNSPLWVIRAQHSGDLVPGKLAVNRRQAFIAHGGREVLVTDFEVLCAPAHIIRWLPASNGQVPARAIVGGQTRTGESLFIGRADHEGSVTPGKIQPSHRALYIAFGSREVAVNQYEVLANM